jgi:hypothetical protein
MDHDYKQRMAAAKAAELRSLDRMNKTRMVANGANHADRRAQRARVRKGLLGTARREAVRQYRHVPHGRASRTRQ